MKKALPFLLCLGALPAQSRSFTANELLDSPLRSRYALPAIQEQLSEIFEVGPLARGSNFHFHLGLRYANYRGFPLRNEFGTHRADLGRVFGVMAVGARTGGWYAVVGTAGSGFGISIPVAVSNPAGDPSGVSTKDWKDAYGPQYLDDTWFVFAGLANWFRLEAWLTQGRVFAPLNGILDVAKTAPIQSSLYGQVSAEVPFLGVGRLALLGSNAASAPASWEVETRFGGLLAFVFDRVSGRKLHTAANPGRRDRSAWELDWVVRGFNAGILYPRRDVPALSNRDSVTHAIHLATPEWHPREGRSRESQRTDGATSDSPGEGGPRSSRRQDLSNADPEDPTSPARREGRFRPDRSSPSSTRSGCFWNASSDLEFFSPEFSAVQGNQSLRSSRFEFRTGYDFGSAVRAGLTLGVGSFSDLRTPGRTSFGYSIGVELSVLPSHLILRASTSRNDPNDLRLMYDLIDIDVLRAEAKVQYAL